MPISPAAALPPPTAEAPRAPRGLGLSPEVIGLFLAFSLLGFATANPLLTVASVALLPFLIALTWVPGEPPVLAFAVAFQWIQATMRVFHANIVGADVDDLVSYPQLGVFADVETAIWLTLAGILVLAIGIRVATWTLPPPKMAAVLREAEGFSISRAFWLYLGTTFTVTALVGSVGFMSGFKQILFAVEELKWATYFFLGYLVLVRREGYGFFFAAFAIEFISGIGFFSGFKEVIFITVVTYFAVRSRVTMGTVAGAVVLAFALAVLGSAWTVVKPEYRATISGGNTNRQGSVVGQEAQVSILVGLVSDLDREDLVEGIEPLAERVAYVDFFGYVLGYVPTVVPHEDGALWGAAFKHVATPRILFPSKPPLISDSEVTNQYTGLGVAGEAQGTSFSIGHIGESYIDFGPLWMFVPLFLIGVGRGLIYRFFLRRGDTRLMGYAFTIAVFWSGYHLEVSTAKLLGGTLMRFIVLALVFRFAAPTIARWLRRDNASEAEDEAVSLPVRRAWA
ncbi:hypothetical protein RQM47_09265 [Rubrivirga sp. S365]|uniref:hypothetical protein n=1 Tax=Rubrivirga sp. S365 TaxID=3076080 RepID=UPI0028CAAFC9|nr:hypothetical protein [Rubrivirga sp. S365]MDT7856828.1 hypothetical protein [Rubrivirga sp. S365]